MLSIYCFSYRNIAILTFCKISYWFLIELLRKESWSSPDHFLIDFLLIPYWIIKKWELELSRPFPCWFLIKLLRKGSWSSCFGHTPLAKRPFSPLAIKTFQPWATAMQSHKKVDPFGGVSIYIYIRAYIKHIYTNTHLYLYV